MKDCSDVTEALVSPAGFRWALCKRTHPTLLMNISLSLLALFALFSAIQLLPRAVEEIVGGILVLSPVLLVPGYLLVRRQRRTRAWRRYQDRGFVAVPRSLTFTWGRTMLHFDVFACPEISGDELRGRLQEMNRLGARLTGAERSAAGRKVPRTLTTFGTIDARDVFPTMPPGLYLGLDATINRHLPVVPRVLIPRDGQRRPEVFYLRRRAHYLLMPAGPLPIRTSAQPFDEVQGAHGSQGAR